MTYSDRSVPGLTHLVQHGKLVEHHAVSSADGANHADGVQLCSVCRASQVLCKTKRGLQIEAVYYRIFPQKQRAVQLIFPCAPLKASLEWDTAGRFSPLGSIEGCCDLGECLAAAELLELCFLASVAALSTIVAANCRRTNPCTCEAHFLRDG